MSGAPKLNLDALLAPSKKVAKAQRLDDFKSWLASTEAEEEAKIAAEPSTKRAKTGDSKAGDKWWEIPEQKLTPEVKRDLQIIQARSYLDPKRFYKVGCCPGP